MMKRREQIYRNEWKYLIPYTEAAILQRKLEPFMQYDSHAKDGSYMIRSLYFDDWKNTAYQQKLMGIYDRKKWRIRIYNCSDRVISLERKRKKGNYIFKESAKLSREEFEKILDCDYAFLLQRQEQLCKEFYVECVSSILRPKVIVDYDRTPMVLESGTVRVTFDSCVRAAIGSFDIFDEMLPTISAMNPEELVLEVKYTEFLPELIHRLLPLEESGFSAFSKYVECYDAARHLTNVTDKINKSTDTWRTEY